jgi:D-amino peptidase
MKLFISADMEGVSSVYKNIQTSPNEKAWEEARKLMTDEVNAAVEGALEAGVTDVVICDSHASGENLISESLHPSSKLVRGTTKTLGMMEGLDSSCDAVFLLGCHAKAGTKDATLPHTYSSRTVYEVRVNGVQFGEIGLNAALAGQFGVPVVLVSGDQSVCAEARKMIRGVTTFQTKAALSGTSILGAVPQVVRDGMREAAKKAIERRKNVKVLRVKTPVKVEIVFIAPWMADVACIIPWFERRGARKIRYICDDIRGAYSAFRAAINLASM